MPSEDVVVEIHPGRRQNGQAGPPSPPGITAAALQNLAFPAVRWVLHPYIPQGLTLFVGKPKGGKSWLMLGVAIAVATGGHSLGDALCTQGDVLYAALEDSERRLKDRMRKLMGARTWPDRLTFWTSISRIEAGGGDELRAWIRAQPDPRLIIIDTFAKVRSPKGRDETAYDADYRAIGVLKAIADETGVAIIVVHHVRKMDADDPLDAVSGTSGLTGAADTILVLKRETAGVTLFGRGRDIEEVEVAMDFDRKTCRWSVLGSASEVRSSKGRAQILEALREEDCALTPVQLATVTGQSRVGVRRLVTKMAKAGELSRPERGKYGLP